MDFWKVHERTGPALLSHDMTVRAERSPKCVCARVHNVTRKKSFGRRAVPLFTRLMVRDNFQKIIIKKKPKKKRKYATARLKPKC